MSDETLGLRYFAGGAETLRRLRALYEERSPAVISAVFGVPSRTLDRFGRTHAGGFCEYPDPVERIRFWDEALRERRAVRDDTVPAAYLSELDQGLYGALIGGEPRYLCDAASGWISSMVAPLFEELPDVSALTADYAGVVWQRYLRQVDVFRQGAEGRFGLSHFILIDSLNFVFELVGATKTYLALIESPERVAPLVDFAFDLNVRVQEAFFEHAGLAAGGTCSNMAGWLPGRVVSESVDPFHMTRADDFETYGREPVQRMFRRFDGGCLHIHGNGRHLLEAVASLDGLRCIYLGDDRGYPPAFDVLAHLKARTGSVPLVVSVGFDPFGEALRRHRLPGGVRYQVHRAPSADAANRAMDQVRAYRAE